MNREIITIEIPNEKDLYPLIMFMLILLIGLTIFGGYPDLLFSFLLFVTILCVESVILFIEYKLIPSNRPNVYKITDDEIWVSEYYKEGNAFTKYKFSNIKKIVLKNRRIKWIRLWFIKYEEYPMNILSAPCLEKCHDEWQRLFEEIRKRIPEDAEVIVK